MAETVVALLLGATIVALTAQTVRALVVGEGRSAALAALTGALVFARAEAVRVGARVVVCGRVESQRPEPAFGCAPAGDPWRHGWIVFVDAAADGNREAGEPLLRIERTAGVAAVNAREAIVFLPSGALANRAPQRLEVVGDGDVLGVVCVGLDGRARSASGATPCT
ncbi:MAG: GspH/FimT family protein [Burkholderiaceae bacterium]|nr:GspH/FimT family protein [Burkholderiaceae bacterium]